MVGGIFVEKDAVSNSSQGAAMNSFNNQDFDDGWMIPETCVSARRIREALAIINSINAGELLAAMPASAGDRHRHQTAVSLLGLLERTLSGALKDIAAGAEPCQAANKGDTPDLNRCFAAPPTRR